MTKDAPGAAHVTNVTYVENRSDKKDKKSFGMVTKAIKGSPGATHMTLALNVEHLPF